MKREVIIEYDADHGLTIPVNLSMPVANNVVGELIRCKDCRYNADCVCVWHSGNDYTWIVDDTDFCSVAERKDEYVTLRHEDIRFIDEDAERAFYESLAERKEE